ncbi:hypothetical protein T4E_6112 [Trichinella pseudospiralis]|uniref:Uncharacterized protein n=1 Tax=Trichinella pseudospiralis TaxID=6337 RepID=A0A0V0Y4W7_TRIPS|nr:hypothetical protein T4E_6112 [Trichinella pseudospiralis]
MNHNVPRKTDKVDQHPRIAPWLASIMKHKNWNSIVKFTNSNANINFQAESFCTGTIPFAWSIEVHGISA